MERLIKVQNNDTGEVYYGKTTADIVRGMMAHGWFEGDQKKEYMAGVQERIEIMFDATIRTSTTRVFLEDLERLGRITITYILAVNA